MIYARIGPIDSPALKILFSRSGAAMGIKVFGPQDTAAKPIAKRTASRLRSPELPRLSAQRLGRKA